MTDPLVWLVTGASSGFGRAIAEAALEDGAAVVAAVRRPAALDDLVAAYPGRVDPIALDVTDESAIGAAVAGALERHGRVDVLVNNADRTQVGVVEEMTADELWGLFEQHFFGPATLTRAVLPHMRERGSGAVVMMSSVGAQLAPDELGAYSAMKFAVEELAEALAAEVAPFGIKVLVVEADGFGGQPGDLATAAHAILAALAADPTPLQLPLGPRSERSSWEKASRGTEFDGD